MLLVLLAEVITTLGVCCGVSTDIVSAEADCSEDLWARGVAFRERGGVDGPRSLSFNAARHDDVEKDEVAGLETRMAEKDVRRGVRATRE